MANKYIKKCLSPCQTPVAHACNPSNSGGRDQEDRGSKPAWANNSQDPISKKPYHKKTGLVEWLKVKALSSSSSTIHTKNFSSSLVIKEI
jgi:hypothetical protein